MKMLELLQVQLRVRLATAFGAIAAMIGLGTGAYHYLENWTWAQAFYFSVTTLTTVGYGDLHPTSDASRMFTAIFILIGVGIMLASLGTIASSYMKMTERQSMLAHEKRLKKKDIDHPKPNDEPEHWPHKPEHDDDV